VLNKISRFDLDKSAMILSLKGCKASPQDVLQ
jgi:hypothetical protein